MTDFKDIKKRLSMSSTLPTSASTMLTGAHLQSHQHGSNCSCCGPAGDEDEDEE